MSTRIPDSQDSICGLAVETLREPAGDGTGPGSELFATFPLDMDKVALVVGDSAGNGGYTAEVSNVLRACLQECSYPARDLSLLNDFVCDAACRGGQEGLGGIRLCLAVVDAVSGECTFAVAGAARPLLLRAQGDVDIIEAEGPLLGALPGFAYQTASGYLGKGDTLLLATDAIVSPREVCLLVAHRQ